MNDVVTTIVPTASETHKSMNQVQDWFTAIPSAQSIWVYKGTKLERFNLWAQQAIGKDVLIWVPFVKIFAFT